MSQISQPLISVIVAVYNGEATIEKTLQSIFSQDYPRYEVIVIDGESTDRTVAIIEKYKEKINYFLSEKDCGVASAYNKGIARSAGDWIYFLNSDDVFCTNSILSDAAKYLCNDIDVLSGIVVQDGGRLFHGRFGWKLLIKNQVHHQSNFYRNTILKKYPYNEKYARYGHDHEHNIVLWKNSIRVIYVNLNIAIWASGGISDMANWQDYCEEFNLRRNTFGIIGYPFNIFTVIRFILKRVKNKIQVYL